MPFPQDFSNISNSVAQQGIIFRDKELSSLTNIIPLAMQRLTVETDNELRQSVLKVNYLMERLRYLNSVATGQQ